MMTINNVAILIKIEISGTKIENIFTIFNEFSLVSLFTSRNFVFSISSVVNTLIKALPIIDSVMVLLRSSFRVLDFSKNF